MRRVLLFVTFFGVSLGLGYPSLNRVVPGAGGLSDIPEYVKLVRFEYDEVEAPFRYRILVPAVAGGLVALLERVPLGTWHREMFGLLLVNALLTAAAALFILETARRIGKSGAEALVAAFFFLSSYTVVNAYLAGFVDPVEAFVIAGCAYLSVTGRTIWLIPLLGVAALGKETAVAFGAVFSLVAIAGQPQPRRWIHWGFAAGLAVVVLITVRVLLGQDTWVEDLWTYRKVTPVLTRAVGVLTAKSLLYTFALPVALAIPRLGSIPAALRRASFAVAAMALVGSAISGIGDNVSRPLFNCTAPLLCIAAAGTLVRFFPPAVAGDPESS